MMEFLFNRSLSQHSGSGSEASEMSKVRRWKIHSRVAFQKVEDGFFVITPDNALHQLNDPVAIRIWELLETEPSSVNDLVDRITGEFDVDAGTAKTDIQEFLAGALQRDMLEEAA